MAFSVQYSIIVVPRGILHKWNYVMRTVDLVFQPLEDAIHPTLTGRDPCPVCITDRICLILPHFNSLHQKRSVVRWPH